MYPYSLNQKAVRQFMEYHELKNLQAVAEMLCISPAYLSQLMSGQRKLNEEMRLRIQIVTHKRQDQLFIPNEEAMPFTHQSFNMAKFYGVKPYEQGSLNLTFQEKDAGVKEDRGWMAEKQKEMKEERDGRAVWMKKQALENNRFGG